MFSLFLDLYFLDYTIKKFYNDIQELLKQFEAVAFVHVRREYNKEADEQANLAIDRHFDEGVETISGDEREASGLSALDENA